MTDQRHPTEAGALLIAQMLHDLGYDLASGPNGTTTRLQQAGSDTTFDMLPGVHEAHTRTPEVVAAYLLDAAEAGWDRSSTRGRNGPCWSSPNTRSAARRRNAVLIT